jgi:hypothetical protein
MIRIRTKLGGNGIKDISSVYTIYNNDRWLTFATLAGNSFGKYESISLMEAGKNHLHAACAIREKIDPAKDWQERARRDNGFIDDDMGGGD